MLGSPHPLSLPSRSLWQRGDQRFERAQRRLHPLEVPPSLFPRTGLALAARLDAREPGALSTTSLVIRAVVLGRLQDLGGGAPRPGDAGDDHDIQHAVKRTRGADARRRADPRQHPSSREPIVALVMPHVAVLPIPIDVVPPVR